ncbi:MAG: hypothetical protein IPL61_36565 [Myxococcales bacterium]|nr:hypothetical protein [Myxococcales bacterium]
MTRVVSVTAGRKVRLVATVTGGDGRPAKFRVAVVDGEGVADLEGVVADGRATAEWVVDLHDRALPADVRYQVFVDGAESTQSVPLRVDPPGALGTPAWLIERTGDGEPGPLAVVDDVDVAAVLAQPHARNVPFTVGDSLLMRVEVADELGQPLAGDFELVFALQKRISDGGAAFRTVTELTAAVSAPGGKDHVVVRWVAQRLDQPPPLDFRFVAWWRRKPNAQPEHGAPHPVESP